MKKTPMEPLGLYIHIPFCPYRCHYCDFLSFTRQEEAIPAYVQSVTADLRFFSPAGRGKQVVSIFFGGGTPSLLSPDQIHEIIASARVFFSLSPDAEITLESNPGTLTAESLRGYRAAGVNRLSLGVQAAQEHHLARMGRIHTFEQAAEAFQAARSERFDNINVDLIFGLPDQTLDEWMETLKKVMRWEPDHFSAYGLQVEEGTPFSSDLKGGRLALPDEETGARMYESAVNAAERNGYERYEISNFARHGKTSLHNLIYWHNGEYLGVGVGAVSYLDGKRFWMTRNLAKYLSGEERIAGSERLSLEGMMGETLMLGLRLREGVSENAFAGRFGRSLREEYGAVIGGFEKIGLLQWVGERLSLTPRGFLVANEVVKAFLADDPGPRSGRTG